ncbi:DUF2283 domain-containing protein [Geodermatophilus sp. SYSU D00697]
MPGSKRDHAPVAWREDDVTLQLTWDGDAGAGHLYLADVEPGEAVSQRVVENPVDGVGDVVLDFDREGRLLGVELLDPRLLPPRLRAR